MKRQRGRNRNKSNNNHNNSNRNLDSNGPDVKVRGSASTIYEKYTTLARDAAAAGSRVKAENYRQHAEHYLRLVNAQEAAKQAAREQAEAARAARGERSNDDDSESQDGENNNESRRSRRYPPRVKRARDNDAGKDETAKKEAVKVKADTPTAEASASEQDTPEGLEVVTPQKETPVADAAPTPKRRRKAPSRKKADDAPAEDVVAAE